MRLPQPPRMVSPSSITPSRETAMPRSTGSPSVPPFRMTENPGMVLRVFGPVVGGDGFQRRASVRLDDQRPRRFRRRDLHRHQHVLDVEGDVSNRCGPAGCDDDDFALAAAESAATPSP